MASMKEVELLIRELRAAERMIGIVQRSSGNKYGDLYDTTQGTRDAMIGGLIERANNLTEALAKLGITP